MIMHIELRKMWEEVPVAYFEALTRYDDIAGVFFVLMNVCHN